VARCLQDRELLRQLIQVKDQRIANLEKENELLKKESELKDKIIAIVEREVDSTRRALNDMKDVADRAIKLSEVGKKSPLMDIIEWIIRMLCFAAGVYVAK
jgi:hypothetical protein